MSRAEANPGARGIPAVAALAPLFGVHAIATDTPLLSKQFRARDGKKEEAPVGTGPRRSGEPRSTARGAHRSRQSLFSWQ
jgi:hypothetical protein